MAWSTRMKTRASSASGAFGRRWRRPNCLASPLRRRGSRHAMPNCGARAVPPSCRRWAPAPSSSPSPRWRTSVRGASSPRSTRRRHGCRARGNPGVRHRPARGTPSPGRTGPTVGAGPGHQALLRCLRPRVRGQAPLGGGLMLSLRDVGLPTPLPLSRLWQGGQQRAGPAPPHRHRLHGHDRPRSGARFVVSLHARGRPARRCRRPGAGAGHGYRQADGRAR